MEPEDKIRLNKYIASRTGLTRREAAEAIKAGRVTVNGEKITDPATFADADATILVDDKPLSAHARPEYWLLNKARDMALSGPESEKLDVVALMRKKSAAALEPILPLESWMSGLQLLTSDAELMTKFEHEERPVKQFFELELESAVDAEALQQIIELLQKECPGFKGADHIKAKSHHWLGIEWSGTGAALMREKLELSGFKVISLDRLYLGGLTKKDLSRGWSRPLEEKEVVFFKYFL